MARKNLKNVQPVELIVEHDQPMATSLQVAKHFDKAHDNVLRDIRNLLKDLPDEWASQNFEDISISTDLGHTSRQDPAYRMTRDGFSLLVMGFTGKAALAWKVKFLDAFKAMEQELWNRKSGIQKIRTKGIDPANVLRGIHALTTYWSVIDNISLKQAQAYLCMHLGIRSLDDMNDEHFKAALKFCSDNADRLHQKTGSHNMNPEQQEILQHLLSAFKGTYAEREADAAYRRCLEIDDFNEIGPEDLPKVAACFWNIWNQFTQYSRLVLQ